MWCREFCSEFFFFFKQKTAYEMRISDWSSDVCSSDLVRPRSDHAHLAADDVEQLRQLIDAGPTDEVSDSGDAPVSPRRRLTAIGIAAVTPHRAELEYAELAIALPHPHRSEEHTSELQSLMRISYAVFCLKKKTEKLIKT